MLVKADSSPISYQATARSEWSSCEITWLGHNTAVVRSGKAAVIVDPWLLPASNRYPETFQPAQRAELGEIDALIITHSHPDHFDPATLLQFRCDTPVIVPRVQRESLLSVEMKTRLLELGFSDVRELDWWESAWIADIEVVALPFYGEQPTSGEQLIPEVRNSGNAYLIRTPGVSCAFVADCGRDSRGDVRDVALEAYRRFGSVDFLFSGYRGWRIYPIQLVESSVPAYALFVPPDLYAVRQSIMNDAAEAVDTAEHWHARYLVPYADGGAPWFWEIGLGPILDGSDGQAREWIHFDPMPERVLDDVADTLGANSQHHCTFACPRDGHAARRVGFHARRASEDTKSHSPHVAVERSDSCYCRLTALNESLDGPRAGRLMRNFENEVLVRSLTEAGPVSELHVELQRSPLTPSGYQWSSPRGQRVTISGGTLCTAEIVTR